jgi:hypothetical protein
MSASAQPTNMSKASFMISASLRRPDAEVAAEIPADPHRIRAVRGEPAALRRGAEPHAGWRSVLVLVRSVVVLPVRFGLQPVERLEVLARRGARAPVERGAWRSVGHIGVGDRLDVRRFVLFLRRRGYPPLPDPQPHVASGSDLLTAGIRLVVEARA